MSTGHANALADAIDQAGDLLQEAEQLPLLPGPLGEAAEGGEAKSLGARRGPGRPPGAKNRKTSEFVEFLERQGYRHPLLVLAETWSRPVDELAATLGCKRLDAFQVQQRALIDSLPYWASKAPLDVKVALPGLTLVVGSIDGGAGAEGDMTLTVATQQNQGVSDVDPAHSNAQHSNAQPPRLENAQPTDGRASVSRLDAEGETDEAAAIARAQAAEGGLWGNRR